MSHLFLSKDKSAEAENESSELAVSDSGALGLMLSIGENDGRLALWVGDIEQCELLARTILDACHLKRLGLEPVGDQER